MRRLLAAMAMMLASFAASAAPLDFNGTITSFERHIDGQWVADTAVNGSPVTVTLIHFYEPEYGCFEPDLCASIPPYAGIYARLTTAGISFSSDLDMPCIGGCAWYDPYRIERIGSRHEAEFADQFYTYDGSTVWLAQLFWSVWGENWIPNGPVTHNAVESLHQPIAGSGSLSYLMTSLASGDTLEGSYRLTFEITHVNVPTPGTLALMAAGALMIGLRRRPRLY